VAVSTTEAPTSKVAMHVPLPCAQSLMPDGRLDTDPLPETPTDNVPILPPPGQRSLAALFTVTLASAITILLDPPVPSGILADISATPHGPAVPSGEVAGGGVALKRPGDDIVATSLSMAQVA